MDDDEDFFGNQDLDDHEYESKIFARDELRRQDRLMKTAIVELEDDSLEATVEDSASEKENGSSEQKEGTLSQMALDEVAQEAFAESFRSSFKEAYDKERRDRFNLLQGSTL